jgi:hypothetical protein
VREGLIKHRVPIAAVAGTILGLGLFIFPGHGEMNVPNLVLAATCGAVFGVSWWAAAGSSAGDLGGPPQE